jgi:hypothetical protein
MFIAISLVLSAMAFWLSQSCNWHWSLGLFLAAIPPLLAFALGIYGLLGGALFLGSLFKAAAK